jgi:hypothetical protein
MSLYTTLRDCLQGSNGEKYVMDIRINITCWLSAFRRDKKKSRHDRMTFAHDIASLVNTVLKESSPIPESFIPTVKLVLQYYYQTCYADSATEGRDKVDAAEEIQLLRGGRTQELRGNKERDNTYRRLLREQNGFVNDVLSILMDKNNNVYSDDDDTASPATQAALVPSSDATATAASSSNTAAPAVSNSTSNTTSLNTEDNEDSPANSQESVDSVGSEDMLNNNSPKRNMLESVGIAEENIQSSSTISAAGPVPAASESVPAASESVPAASESGDCEVSDLVVFLLFVIALNGRVMICICLKVDRFYKRVAHIVKAVSIFHAKMKQQRRQYSVQDNNEATGLLFCLYICVSETLRILKAGITRSQSSGIKNR